MNESLRARMFLRGRPVYSIEEFVNLEIAASPANQSGVFVDAVCVDTPVPGGFQAFLEIAKDAEGNYYVSCHAITTTGYSGFSPSGRWGSHDSREEAFVAGINLLQKRFHNKVSRKWFSEAKKEYFRCSHRQLELFRI